MRLGARKWSIRHDKKKKQNNYNDDDDNNYI